MSSTANIIFYQALELSSVESADVAKKLICSLDIPYMEIDKLWAKEADMRIEAHKKGKLETISAGEVFAK